MRNRSITVSTVIGHYRAVTIDFDHRRLISGSINQGKQKKKRENLEIRHCSPDLDPSPAGFLVLRWENLRQSQGEEISPRGEKKCLPLIVITWKNVPPSDMAAPIHDRFKAPNGLYHRPGHGSWSISIPYKKATSNLALSLKAYDVCHVSKVLPSFWPLYSPTRSTNLSLVFDSPTLRSRGQTPPLPKFQWARSRESVASHAIEPDSSATIVDGEDRECHENIAYY
ncbi:hypothetical protein B296_00049592 [Ensete ventricosum]|uniref:Uncharacterized protein n=1 Tax=Ensete ventricosum TaxID=4639 RepID=A0A426YQ19_ENSVE|nr:hypothetical protein B296_00049592 [Ensete ventricosum]